MRLLRMTDTDLRNKRVLIREDLNVPVQAGVVTSDARIRAALATIRYALDQHARVFIMSHLGRPQEGQETEALTLAPVAARLSDLLGKPVPLRKQWIDGLDTLFGEITTPGVRKVYLGNIPLLPQVGPECLSSHPDDVQACSAPLSATRRPLALVDLVASARAYVPYVDPTPWFCSTTCTAVIGSYTVYMDRFHVSATYARYLQVVLGRALGLLPAGAHG